MSVNDARTLLVQKKLGLGGQTEQYSDQPVGTIISQSPGEGASAKLNTRVSVVVSAGPEPAPEPEAPSESASSSGSSGGGGWRPVRQRQLVLVQHCRQREQQRLLREHRRPRRLVDVVAGVRERL